MSLKQTIQDDMKSAMKAGEKDRLRVIRMLLAAIKQQEVDERKDVDDAAVLAVLNRMVKQRRDSVAQFRGGGRDDLADAEEAEIVVLQDYLPEQLSDDEVNALVEAAIAESGASGMKDMGRVMSIVRGKAEGRADLGAVSAKVKARLG